MKGVDHDPEFATEFAVGPAREYVFLDRIRRELRYALAGLAQDANGVFDRFEVTKGGYALTDTFGRRYIVRYDVEPAPSPAPATREDTPA